MRAWILLLGLAVTGCGSSGSGKDGGGGGICPDNPMQCGGSCCGDVCVDTSADKDNCGNCGTKCDSTSICVGGHCGCLPSGAPCAQGQTCCPGVGCKFTDSDINNCGGCGTTCQGTGAMCSAGTCSCGGTTCAPGQSCCSGVCMASCPTPDMSMVVANCSNCTKTCSLACVGNMCCLEDFIIAGTCTPDPACFP